MANASHELRTPLTAERTLLIERREPFDLADLAARVVEHRGEVARHRGVRLNVKPDPATGTGDPRLAESLIANLVDNALRYNVPAAGRKCRL